jgi:squalene synthase HpnC
LARARRHVEGPRASDGVAMTGTLAAADLQSGKGHRDENFPVASWLIHPRHRPAILAFYRFVRAADDIADHPTAAPAEKLRLLEAFRATLFGESDAVPEGVALRTTLKDRSLTPQHAADLLEAFRRDVTVLRYADWDSLIDYCRYSAMPVGRFVLDVHGETRAAWPANDALCAALQIVNHLQDCGKDYRDLDRVYIPLDVLSAAGIGVETLAAGASSPALRHVISGLAERTRGLLETSRPFAGQIRDARLALEVSVIQSLAEDLAAKLMRRDPLRERVHHTKLEAMALLMGAVIRFYTRPRTNRTPGHETA